MDERNANAKHRATRVTSLSKITFVPKGRVKIARQFIAGKYVVEEK